MSKRLPRGWRDGRPHRPFTLRPADTISPLTEDGLSDPKRRRAESREWSRRSIARLRAQYVVERNPLFVWQAYFEARGAQLRIPEWVHDYFDLACRNLFMRLRTPPGEGEIDSAIASAFGFVPGGITVTFTNNGYEGRATKRGTYNPFTRPDDFQYAVQVYDLVLQGHKPTNACATVAEAASVSATTVGNAWRSYRKLFFRNQ